MRIVVDGAVDVPDQLADSPMLRTVSGQVWLADKPFTGGPEQFWALIRKGIYPSTTPPTVSALEEAYRDPDLVVAVHVSRELSTTTTRAQEAASRCGGGVVIVDTRSLSVGAGLIAAAIHRAAEASSGHDSIVDYARSLPDRLHTFALIQDVEALRRSDRSGLLPKGRLARSHPLVLAVRGRVVPLEQAKNRSAGVKDLVLHLGDSTGGDLGAWALGHGDASDRDSLVDQLTRALGKPPSFVAFLDPTVGVHAGPDALIVAAISGAANV